jgi:hypothetical protein
MSSAQVERTIVKSPPELWAELSDPAALARHLGELGEIRITRIEPEHKVEWTAERTSGTVLLKPSGWGTRVTLTASHELDEPAGASPGPSEPPRSPSLVSETHTAVAEAHAPRPPARIPPAPTQAAESAPEREPAEEPQGPPTRAPATRQSSTPSSSQGGAPIEPITRAEARELIAWQPEPQSESPRGVFARLMGRWRRAERATEPERVAPEADLSREDPHATATPPAPPEPRPAASSPEPRQAQDATAQTAEPTSAGMLPPRSTQDIELSPQKAPSPQASKPATSALRPASAPPAGEPGARPSAATPPQAEPAEQAEQAPESASGELEAVLTSVLDRLGSAHHRPFSRS